MSLPRFSTTPSGRTAVHYLAYGSNLHPARLAARVPSARPVGVVEISGYSLAFHKRSVDGSAKCLLYPGQGPQQKAYGVIYEFDAREKDDLDRHEGKGNGYYEQLVRLPLNAESYTPYLYLARSTHIDPDLVPYDWYKALVVAGARFHNFPAEYVAAIEATPSRPDPDPARAQQNEQLLRSFSVAGDTLEYRE